jgi:acetoacetate decarboxylase
MEVIVSISVLHKGQPYAYITAIYVDNDAALLAGRELGGYPKKMAQITMRNYGNLCNAVLGAFILRGDMYTDASEWVLIEDLKKSKAK